MFLDDMTEKEIEEDYKELYAGYVYVIKCNDCYKIGKSESPERRFADLQTSNPYQLDLIYHKRFFQYSLIERSVHKALCEFRVKGEWFELSPDQVKRLVGFLDSHDFLVKADKINKTITISTNLVMTIA